MWRKGILDSVVSYIREMGGVLPDIWGEKRGELSTVIMGIILMIILLLF